MKRVLLGHHDSHVWQVTAGAVQGYKRVAVRPEDRLAATLNLELCFSAVSIHLTWTYTVLGMCKAPPDTHCG